MSEKLAWYVSRSSGWVAFVLLACTVIWGVLGISKLIERRGLPRWLLDLHRHLAFLTVVFTGVHLAALVADNYMRIAWKEILVPFAMDYRPGAVAWGVVALYLLVAVQVSSWLRSRMPRRWWRRIHFLSYPTLWMVTMHGLRAGTDAGRPLVRWGVVTIVAAVAFVTFWRVFTVAPRRRRSDQVDTLTPDETQRQVDGSGDAGDDRRARPDGVRVG